MWFVRMDEHWSIELVSRFYYLENFVISSMYDYHLLLDPVANLFRSAPGCLRASFHAREIKVMDFDRKATAGVAGK